MTLSGLYNEMHRTRAIFSSLHYQSACSLAVPGIRGIKEQNWVGCAAVGQKSQRSLWGGVGSREHSPSTT